MIDGFETRADKRMLLQGKQLVWHSVRMSGERGETSRICWSRDYSMEETLGELS